ncbi:chitin disaccharide deacetylase [Pontibacillus litoralis]|uniref:Polysaccharide deacetylase n=1 Tax=Pontibacillus litoralis JSM 072002 TaxID=1385512 RepID=A0A0A5G484_9BACI|nr:chitin disaccharide deacetylase [Pontibacillus litoralis]KGX86864.1 polysaccharide deacetylase [Pontibacillus litoralis JSM 072002]
MKKLIINADDFGYSRGVNYGIIDAFQQGLLTSTTLMANMPGAEQAYALAKETPSLGIGVHLTLTAGSPISPKKQTITDEYGRFRQLKYYLGFFDVDLQEVYEEWKAQIEAVYSNGIEPTHIDSHHHIHTYGKLIDVYSALAKEYDLPVRRMFPDGYQKDEHLLTTDAFELKVDTLKDPASLAKHHESATSIEIMAHPAYLDKAVLNGSSFTYPRVDELAMLTNKEVNSLYEQHEVFELVNYRDLIRS